MSIKFINRKSKINIFMQEIEPELKEGIWIKSNKQIDKIEIVNNLITGNGSWRDNTYPSIPYDFYDGTAVSIGTDIYLFGGQGNSTNTYKYNTLTKAYTKLTNIPISFYNCPAVAIGTNIYLFYGTSSVSQNTGQVYKYDTLTDEYTQLATIPYTIYTGKAAVVGTDIYLFGGNGNANLKKTYKYDTLTNTFTNLNISSPLSFSSTTYVATINNLIYCFFQNDTYVYNTISNEYTLLLSQDFTLNYQNGANVIGTNIYIFYNNSKSCKFDTLTNIYTQLEDIPKDFNRGSTVVVDNNIYLLGGELDNSTNIQVYSLPDQSFENNSIVVVQGNATYKTQMYEDYNITGRLLYGFSDVQYNTTENGLDNTLETYYGTGTEWVKFKN